MRHAHLYGLTGLVAATLAAPALANDPVAGQDDASSSGSMVLTGVVRDFNERTADNGHPDFERRPDGGFGLYCGNVAAELGSDKKPVYTGAGFKLTRQYYNRAGQPISWSLYDPDLGDQAGSHGASDGGGIESSASFSSWFRDVLGVNSSRTLNLEFTPNGDGSFVFDSNQADWCQEVGGFFPIENQLLGNPGGSPDRNFHFTFELHTEFTYDAAGAQTFQFRGDDDVWVFINDRLVIDLGGVHSAIEQVVELDRLGLVDGETYELSFFFAERHRTQSNFRIQTNLQLETVELPTVTAAYD